ncbi:MAG: hypothetical protein JXM69_17965 [Anaerolineae bacterium]|nr:hypothetical protein [Anaerolineae bacterium]
MRAARPIQRLPGWVWGGEGQWPGQTWVGQGLARGIAISRQVGSKICYSANVLIVVCQEALIRIAVLREGWFCAVTAPPTSSGQVYELRAAPLTP